MEEANVAVYLAGNEFVMDLDSNTVFIDGKSFTFPFKSEKGYRLTVKLEVVK